MRKYSVNEKIAFVRRFHEQRCSAAEFCRINNLIERTFSDWVIAFERNQLKEVINGDNVFRVKTCRFATIEQRLVDYIKRRAALYQRDKCGLSWLILKNKALQVAQEVMPDVSFNASAGWLQKVLIRNGFVGVTLHGEANEIDDLQAAVDMREFRARLDQLCHDLGIVDEDTGAYDLSRVYNADQTGLFYQKLPNRTYCEKSAHNTVRGVKQMKDKTRITLMLCCSAAKKAPLAIVGKSADPRCFSALPKLQGVRLTPMKYTIQTNAWFDTKVMFWWLTEVFWPHCNTMHMNKPVRRIVFLQTGSVLNTFYAVLIVTGNFNS